MAFLVDTGSAYSIIPHRSKKKQCGPKIMTADRTPIRCWGYTKRTVTAGGRHMQWAFLMADVAFPIVGADFLIEFDLKVDLKRLVLITNEGQELKLAAPPVASVYAPLGVVAADGSTSPSLPTEEAPSSPANSHLRFEQGRPPAAASSTAKGHLRPEQCQPPAAASSVQGDLIELFPEVVCQSGKLPPVKHNVVHVIETTCNRPITAKYRRLDAEKLKAAKEEFEAMEQQGIVRRSGSAWASPLHMVRKADGSWRPCGDYRRLNLATKTDLYPPPHMEDLAAQLAGCTVFSKLDLRKGYYQVPVAAADVEKTAVITPFGLYEFLRMPFGLKNAGQSFQRLMDNCLQGLSGIFVYLDDILVASRSKEEHNQHLRAVLERLDVHGLVINREKCVFAATSVDYLGHHVTGEGIRPMETRVAAILDFPPPATRSQLQGFLGMVNFYRRFIKGAAAILKPLTDATRGEGTKNSKVPWTQEMSSSFVAAKTALARAAVLAHPDPTAEVALAVDASGSHVGGVLQQRVRGGGWQPLSFFSRKLSKAEERYSTFDRELLACVAALRHFRFLLEGRVFHILTDHKPLTHAVHRLSDAWSARVQRHLGYVAEFTGDVRHVSGVDNVVADTLSRPVAAVNAFSSATPILWEELASSQESCEETRGVLHAGSLQLKHVEVEGGRVWCDMSTGTLRPVVPINFRRRVFQSVHELAHAGTRATRRLVSARFVWPGLARDIKEWCRQCVNCSRAKVTRQEKSEVEKIPIPATRFTHVHVDLVGPWPPSRAGHTHALTVVDRSSRWPEVCPIRGVSTGEVLHAFVATWVSRFGVPARVTTDRGAQFTSGEWKKWCQQHGVEHITTTSYHPQSNGLVERLHRQIKDALRAREGSQNWTEHLPWVLLGIRSAPKEESGVSTGEATFGQQLRIPGQLVLPQEEEMQPPYVQPAAIPATKRSYAEVVSSPSPLDEAEWVFVRRGAAGGPLAQNYSGPYKVARSGRKVFHVHVGKRVETISRDRLVAYRGEVGPQEVAEPPLRGRPPGTGGV